MSEAIADEGVEYTDHFTFWCEQDFGEGFLSPGGRDEVARIVGGIDLTGKEVLDIGVGLAGPACVLVEEHGADVLGKVAKTHFKLTPRILNLAKNKK